MFVLTGAILGCGSDDLLTPESATLDEITASEAAQIIKVSYPAEWVLYRDCLGDGRGDTIHGQGTYNATRVAAVTPSGTTVWNTTFEFANDWTMVGLDSGHSYSILPLNESRDVQVMVTVYAVTHIETFRCRDDVTGRVYDWPFRLHLTCTPDGELAAEVEMFPCRSIPNDGEYEQRREVPSAPRKAPKPGAA